MVRGVWLDPPVKDGRVSSRSDVSPKKKKKKKAQMGGAEGGAFNIRTDIGSVKSHGYAEKQVSKAMVRSPLSFFEPFFFAPPCILQPQCLRCMLKNLRDCSS